MLVVEDARVVKSPATRQIELAVWDVKRLHLYAGKPPGHIEIGDRFQVRITIQCYA
jgi:hypothetical protein